ncbi:MAG: glycosyltransferase [Pseudomonadota bacterium]|nr:glycosyltransferase [Sphingomonas sp.]MDQ3483307.1 glycosyltransferase [Pseudomonadota bacterium]
MRKPRDLSGAQLICDVTQSWSEVGGGVGTYLRRKREYILSHTPHRHLLIIPGEEDSFVEDGRKITVTIASPRVPGSPNYRLLLRNRAVIAAFERYRPDVIECQDSYNLPWAAVRYRRDNPETAIVAGYFTDFPTAYVHRPLKRFVGNAIAGQLRSLSYRYCGLLYRKFDCVYALSESGGAAKLRELGVGNVGIVPLGVQIDEFNPQKRDPDLRRSLGIGEDQPLLIYVGRLDRERRAQLVVDAFRKLPRAFGARLVLIGEGPIRDEIPEDERIIAPGYLTNRSELARWLASADMYVSAMADETFGVSVIEAQASGLPVVGVAAGAMLDRVDEETGKLAPVDDSSAIAANILELWQADRAAMGRAARDHVEGRFSWERTFKTLFGEVYPQAFEARRAAVQRNAVSAYASGTAA